MILFSKEEYEDDDFLQEPAACLRRWIPSTSTVETGCSPYSFIALERKCSATTNIFRSLDMLIPRIFLVFDSIATQSQMYSKNLI